MLVNKSDSPVKLKYNGITVEVEAGKGVDVRDFGVVQKNAKAVELDLMKKHPGKFDQKESSTGSAELDKELNEKIDALKKSVDELTTENAALKAGNKEATDKIAAMAGEAQTLSKTAEGLQEQVNTLKAELEKRERPDNKKKN